MLLPMTQGDTPKDLDEVLAIAAETSQKWSRTLDLLAHGWARECGGCGDAYHPGRTDHTNDGKLVMSSNSEVERNRLANLEREWMAKLAEEERAEARLHHKAGDGDWCACCGNDWPCWARSALDKER